MNTFKTILMAATALSMTASMAAAGGNVLFLDQPGIDGTATITHSGNDNEAGKDGAQTRIVQGGKDNVLIIDQTGDRNKAGTGSIGIEQQGLGDEMEIVQSGNDNTIIAATQRKEQRNEMTVTQSSNGNVIGTLDQDGRFPGGLVGTNTMTILQEGADGNTISRAEQDGVANTLQITQNGANNIIGIVLQGDFNDGVTNINSQGFAITNSASGYLYIEQLGNDHVVGLAGQSGLYNGLSIYQSGADQEVGNAVLIGDNNGGPIRQYGSENFANTEVVGLNNGMQIYQDGHNLSASIGINGNINLAIIAQPLGSGSDGSISIDGSSNLVAVEQNDNDHVAELSVSGNENRVEAYQQGNDHTIEVSISGDLHTGHIQQTGSFNSLVGVVSGTGNTFTTTQSGTGNSINFSQGGSGNTFTSTQL